MDFLQLGHPHCLRGWCPWRWSLLARTRQRPINQHIFRAPESHAFVHVIDSSDELGEMYCIHLWLTDQVSRQHLQDSPFLLLANKQDKENALCVECVKERIQFDELLKHHSLS